MPRATWSGSSFCTRAKIAPWIGQVVLQAVNITCRAETRSASNRGSVVATPSFPTSGRSGAGTGGRIRP